MSTIYGPQTEAISALISRIETLTPGEVDRLSAPRDAAHRGVRHGKRHVKRHGKRHGVWDEAWYAAWYATLDAARDAAWDEAWYAAWYATRHGAWGAVWHEAWDAALDAARSTVWDAILALLVRDLISAEHYRLLTYPCASVIGPVHPEDPCMTEGTQESYKRPII